MLTRSGCPYTRQRNVQLAVSKARLAIDSQPLTVQAGLHAGEEYGDALKGLALRLVDCCEWEDGAYQEVKGQAVSE